MAKVNNKTKGFNSISRELVFDNVLSDRARFVYVYMACKPDGWDFFQDKVAEELGYKKATLRKYLDELIMRGWIVEEEQENEGKFGALQYTIENERKKGENLPIRKKPDTQKTRYGKNHNQKDIDNNSSPINSPTIRDIDIEKPTKVGKKSVVSISKEEQEKDEQFEVYMKENYPYLMRMDKPLTRQEAKKLKELYGEEVVLDVFNAMNNHKRLLRDYRSAYQTANNWCTRRIQNEAK